MDQKIKKLYFLKKTFKIYRVKQVIKTFVFMNHFITVK